jgi:chemotaxis protein methyltransferase CheR
METATAAISTDADAFEYIIDVIYERCRIRLHEGKEALIAARLAKRMRHFGFPALAQYCEFLRTRGDEDEFTHVVNALTTNYTSFLREEDHFKFLVDEALPSLLRSNGRRFHIWSAACSTGEEPYSIAFYLNDRYSPAAGWDWQITASDISTKVLDTARLGMYTTDRLRALPREYLLKCFQRGFGQWDGYWRVKKALIDRIAFRQINLLSGYTHSQRFEVIFCRNVMIYFDRPTQQQLINHMCRFLAPGGYILIGHSESLNGLKVPLRCVRPSVYTKES